MRGWICDLVAEHLSTVARPWGQTPLQEHNKVKRYHQDIQQRCADSALLTSSLLHMVSISGSHGILIFQTRTSFY